MLSFLCSHHFTQNWKSNFSTYPILALLLHHLWPPSPNKRFPPCCFLGLTTPPGFWPGIKTDQTTWLADLLNIVPVNELVYLVQLWFGAEKFWNFALHLPGDCCTVGSKVSLFTLHVKTNPTYLCCLENVHGQWDFQEIVITMMQYSCFHLSASPTVCLCVQCFLHGWWVQCPRLVSAQDWAGRR